MTRLLSYLRFGYPWMIVWVCAVHLTIGFGLIARERTESLLVISGLNRFIDFPYVDRYVLAGALILGAFLALIGVALEGVVQPKKCLALLILQYGLVVASTLSSMVVLVQGRNPAPAGMQVDRVVILVVLCYGLYAGVFHTLSILERFVIEPRKAT